VILLDVNLLLYAHNAGAKEHERAATWLRDALAGSETVGFSWETILGFLSLINHTETVCKATRV
jgi:hypothetical protein